LLASPSVSIGRSLRALEFASVSFAALAAAGCAGRSLPPQNAPSASETPPSFASSSSRTGRTYGWVGIGVGAESAVAALVTSVMILHDKSVRDANCSAEKICSPAGLDANQDIGLLEGWNAGAWIVAAAGLGIGAYLILTEPVDGGQRTAIAIGPIGSGTGLGLRSSF
jgi:hypothetical protein